MESQCVPTFWLKFSDSSIINMLTVSVAVYIELKRKE